VAFDDLHTDFDFGFVPGFLDACGNHGDAVVLSEFSIGGVQLGFVEARGFHARFEVIRHDDLWTPPKNSSARTCDASQSALLCVALTSQYV
jgi:hypothetical protein